MSYFCSLTLVQGYATTPITIEDMVIGMSRCGIDVEFVDRPPESKGGWEGYERSGTFSDCSEMRLVQRMVLSWKDGSKLLISKQTPEKEMRRMLSQGEEIIWQDRVKEFKAGNLKNWQKFNPRFDYRDFDEINFTVEYVGGKFIFVFSRMHICMVDLCKGRRAVKMMAVINLDQVNDKNRKLFEGFRRHPRWVERSKGHFFKVHE